jgi:hypothetical protein
MKVICHSYDSVFIEMKLSYLASMCGMSSYEKSLLYTYRGEMTVENNVSVYIRFVETVL